MSEYLGAKYIGTDPIHLIDGSLILPGEITQILSPEAAENDNMFEPVYGSKNKVQQQKPKNKKTAAKIKDEEGE